MNRTIALLALPLALLGACKGGGKQQGAGKAEGEILPGSASDAMLPLDTVRSQAPLAPRAEGGEKGKAAAGSATEAADAETQATSAAPDPVEEPQTADE
jgi:hypothetical protein